MGIFSDSWILHNIFSKGCCVNIKWFHIQKQQQSFLTTTTVWEITTNEYEWSLASSLSGCLTLCNHTFLNPVLCYSIHQPAPLLAHHWVQTVTQDPSAAELSTAQHGSVISPGCWKQGNGTCTVVVEDFTLAQKMNCFLNSWRLPSHKT